MTIHRSFKRQPRGFTLIELLVVIAIIGVLVGLLLPAVQQAREAARRASCTNKLKQLALACHNFADANKRFPAAHTLATAGGTDYPSDSWFVQIMPYLELQDAYDVIQTQPVGWYRRGNATISAVIDQHFEEVRCPSALRLDPPTRTQETFKASWGGASGSYSDYAGCAGVSSSWNGPSNEVAMGGNMGAMRIVEGVRFQDITDGTTSTILLGETSGQPDPASTRSDPEAAVRSLISTTNHKWNAPKEVARYGSVKMKSGSDLGFNSDHEGIVLFAMTDGSVKALSEDIGFNHHGFGNANNNAGRASYDSDAARGVYQKLCHRADGNVAGL